MKHKYAAVHKAADYYEPLFRARFVRAMRQVRASVSVQDLAIHIGNRQISNVVSRAKLAAALQPNANIIRDAFNHGGKIGADRLQDYLS